MRNYSAMWDDFFGAALWVGFLFLLALILPVPGWPTLWWLTYPFGAVLVGIVCRKLGWYRNLTIKGWRIQRVNK
ncbi:hypothetical protein HWB05_gp011 [Streptomyces phage BRock]|uniref:Transmembrane protein n=1 Tax=Streptomyces phage BRock TaxID=1913591 RepID=A0A1J0GVR2_9CAUD|nr:hypothetical protein HWB05_gp011 [Streptomyces phage BRock]APC46273.2 hypothetical protein [Streptomyces phage BRock]